MTDITGPAGNHYDKYATGNPIERRMMSSFLRTIDDLTTATNPPVSILEVGVGEGHILQRLTTRYPSSSALGIDLPDEGLTKLWEQRGVPAEVGDVTNLRFADRAFDLVLAIEVLEHVADPRRALCEINRVASGTVVLSVPREPIWRIGNLVRGRYVRSLGNTPGHVNHWSAKSFTRFVDSVLEVEQVATPLPWVAVRARRR